jgi:hypothetical protein
MMRCTLALPLLACLSACSNMTADQQAKISQAVAVACKVDGVLVPIGQPIVATIGPGGQTAATVDTLLVHPAVVAACSAIKGTPAEVTAIGTPVAVPTEPAVSVTH